MLRELINLGDDSTPAAPTEGYISLPLAQIRTDGGTQPRAGLDPSHVADLAEAIDSGAQLPPVDVMHDGEHYWLIDGFHRVAVARERGANFVTAKVHQGSQADAQWASYAVNKTHGLKRTNEDKQRAIKAALQHPNGASRSNSAIAKHVGVDDKTVAYWRERLEAASEIPKVTERMGADGKVYSTVNIGTSKPDPAAANDRRGQWLAESRQTYRRRWLDVTDRAGSRQSHIDQLTNEMSGWIQSYCRHYNMAPGLINSPQHTNSTFWQDTKAMLGGANISDDVLKPAIRDAFARLLGHQAPAIINDEAHQAASAAALPPLIPATAYDVLRILDNISQTADPAGYERDWLIDYVGTKLLQQDKSCDRTFVNGWISEWIESWQHNQRIQQRLEHAKAAAIEADQQRSAAEAQAAAPQAPDKPMVQWTNEEWDAYRQSKDDEQAAALAAVRSITPVAPAVPTKLSGWTLHGPLPGGWYLTNGNVRTLMHLKPEDAFDEAWSMTLQAAITVQLPPDVPMQPQRPDALATPADDADDLPVSQRDGYDSDEWYTPTEYIEAARRVMGTIDLDPATSELAQTVVQAAAYLTKADNGLVVPRWIRANIWLNPPYSNPGAWINKLLAEVDDATFVRQAVVLINNATETSWFQTLLQRGYPCCLPTRRLAFWRHDQNGITARQGQAFFYIGPNVDQFVAVFGQFGPILRRIDQ